MNNIIPLSADSHTTLLLCSNMAIPKTMANEYQLFGLTEWNELARKITSTSLERPGTFLTSEPEDWRREMGWNSAQSDRVLKLLSRRLNLALELKRFEDMGIWVTTRSEAVYPVRYKKLLREKAPIILYGSGDISIVRNDGVAFAGSRDADEEAINFTRDLARGCTREGMAVISGGARGVDTAAEEAAVNEGGRVISVLSCDLAKAVRKRLLREALLDHRLLLLSPYHPNARFSAGTAMGRNKHIYALAKWAVVVSATEGRGGTWAGAMENLKQRWVPLMVRKGDHVPSGNQALIKSGAVGIDSSILGNMRVSFNNLQNIENGSWTNRQQAILSLENQGHYQVNEVPLKVDHIPDVPDLYNIVWGYLKEILSHQEECNVTMLAETLNVQKKQMEIWMNRAVDEGKLIKMSHPVRYRLVSGDNDSCDSFSQQSLF
ncbi:MAG: DNA-processing protein DprA [Syntrophomonas sp.]|nr:DNA-processing protein DprA [Syntrophomonas sp.]